MNYKMFFCSIVFFCLFFPFALFAQAHTVKLIITANNKTISLSLTDIKVMPHTSLSIKGHDGNHVFQDVSAAHFEEEIE